MATFVLVHGAWHGGWCWKKLVPHLRAAGHAVYTPTLTGVGERAHLLTRAVNVDTHVQDVLAVLACEDLHEVILVGHSYAGLLLPVIANAAPERIAKLVYLDATVAQSGLALFDRYPQTREQTAEAVRTVGEGWRVPPPPWDFGVTDPADLAWLRPRLTPQPLAACEQPADYARDPRTFLPCTYIACIGDKAPGGQRFPEGEGMTYLELGTGHDAMITAPREVAQLLLA
jgi:pimeloyl-ACP methyl ester carboxylesterase